MIKEYSLELSNGNVSKILIKWIDKQNSAIIVDMLNDADEVLASNQWLTYSGSNKMISLTSEELSQIEST